MQIVGEEAGDDWRYPERQDDAPRLAHPSDQAEVGACTQHILRNPEKVFFGPSQSRLSIRDRPADERMGIVFQDGVLTCGVPGPVDLPYEVRQDKVGATGVDEQKVAEVGGTD